jgi:cell division protein FtsX
VTIRRQVAVVLGVCLIVTLAACGGAKKTTRPGRVRVYFCTTVSMPDCKADATRAQELAVGTALLQSPHVLKAVFVSKTAGLKRAKKQNPPLPYNQLSGNPLPDEWVVTVDSDANNATVGKAICAAGYPGVERCRVPGELGGVQWDILTARIRRLR